MNGCLVFPTAQIWRQGAGFTDDDIIGCRNDFFIALVWLEEAVIPIPEGTDFTKTLAREYLAYADFEATRFKDWIDSRFFSRKGLRAANADRDNEVLPELLSRWNLVVDDEVPQYIDGRKRLIAALDAGARKSWPVDAAVAQARDARFTNVRSRRLTVGGAVVIWGTRR